MTHPKHKNIFLRMHPLHRIAISLVVAALVFLLCKDMNWSKLLLGIVVWNAFSLTHVVASLVVFFTRSHSEIRSLAQEEDGSRWLVISFVLLSAFASMGNILLLFTTGKGSLDAGHLSVILAFTGMLLSWLMVHTLFVFHYARLFYDERVEGGLVFPGESNPDYLDFTYFSFVIGMTFQVSDVEITSGKIRRLVLLHSILSFGLNTFAVALTINIIAGLVR